MSLETALSPDRPANAHGDLHSEEGAQAREHRGRAPNPLVKVRDLAWLMFEKPDLDRAETFARDFGFTVTARTEEELRLRGSFAGTDAVVIRRGPRSRFVGPVFQAAEAADLDRLARRTGSRVRDRGRGGAGRIVDLVDPTGIPVGVVTPLNRLPVRLKAIVQAVEEPIDRSLADTMPARLEFGRQLGRTLAGPPQRRHGIAPRQRFHQQVQRLGHAWLRVFHVGTAGAWLANPSGEFHAAREFSPAISNRLPRQPGRRGHEAVPTVPNGGRLRGRPKTARPLIEQRGHHHELAHDGGFHVGIAFHRTGLSTGPLYIGKLIHVRRLSMRQTTISWLYPASFLCP